MRKYSRLLVAMICALALSLTACGGGSSSDQSSKPGLKKVSLAITGLNSLHIWMIVARDEKLMEPAGIDLNLIIFSSQAQVVPALLSGSAQFASSTPEQAIAAGLKQPDLKMVISDETSNPYSVVVAPDINTLADLKGKKIGVNAALASEDYFTGRNMLGDIGLRETRDYAFTNVGITTARVAALNAKQVSGLLLFPPDTLQALQSGNKIIAQASDSPSMQGAEFGTLVSLQSWYNENRDTAVAFARGYQNTIKWLYDPANRNKAITDIANQMKVSQQAAAITFDYFYKTLPRESATGEFELPYLQKMLKNAHDDNLPSLASVKDSDLGNFYDNSLTQAAAKTNG
jgi:ABC-type nitrate/sulfonate/bicarbonate transport system substrate-binding protein